MTVTFTDSAPTVRTFPTVNGMTQIAGAGYYFSDAVAAIKALRGEEFATQAEAETAIAEKIAAIRYAKEHDPAKTEIENGRSYYIYGPMDRADYETACRAIGVEPASDEDIADSYAARYYDSGAAGVSATSRIAISMHLQHRRLVALDEAKRAQATPTSEDDSVLYRDDDGYDTRRAEYKSCRVCGQSGYAGSYPFSTLPDGGTCDDCV